MFDPAYLDRMALDELETLVEDVERTVKKCRERGDWALAWWWRREQTKIMDALYRCHLERADPRFHRAQMTFEGMPGRVAPEDRLAD